MESDEQEDYGLVMSFWIDTDGYSDREREMFVAGVEFQMVYESIKNGNGWAQPIREENAPRVRMMLNKLGIGHYKLTPLDHGWVDLLVPHQE